MSDQVDVLAVVGLVVASLQRDTPGAEIRGLWDISRSAVTESWTRERILSAMNSEYSAFASGLMPTSMKLPIHTLKPRAA